MDPFYMAEVFKEKLFTIAETIEKDCKHPQDKIQSFPDGCGYCTICGFMFNDVLNIDSDINLTNCKHERVSKDDSEISFCTDCGKEINNLDHSQEWRWFGNSDNRSKKNPSRCNNIKTNPKGIKTVFDQHSISISPALIKVVEAKFEHVLEVSENKVQRGSGREAIIAACLFYTYQEFGECRTSIYIRNMFKLDQKNMSAGLTKYLLAFPDDRTKNITPQKLIPWMMKLTGIGQEHYCRIIQLIEYLHSATQLIKRSNPQSIAASTIYFYLCLFPTLKEQLGMTKVKFAEKINLSAITIEKIVLDMATVSGMNVIEWKKYLKE
jgi:transcription initiation factor TFIIIB Brf1 subunit/transcription initiation factor TFIIB